MKKIMLAALGAVMCITMLFAAGCGNGGVTATIYTVSVTGGTGGGYYYENDNCKVTAEVPDGKQFLKWMLDGEDASANAEFVFKVTGDAELVAVFNDAFGYAGEKVFTVKTQNGVGDGGYLKGSDCTVKVVNAESDRSFSGWAAVDAEGAMGAIVSTANPYTFKVTENVSLAAQFNDVRLDTPYGTLVRISSTPSWGDVIIELDRVKDANGTALTDAHGSPLTKFDGRIQYIMIHVFDSLYAKNPVAKFKFVQNANVSGGKLMTLDGQHEFGGIVGGPGNYYRDWISIGDFVPFFSAAVGESYSAATTYYFASQLIAKDEPAAWGTEGQTQLFADSGVSPLNNEHFREADKRS